MDDLFENVCVKEEDMTYHDANNEVSSLYLRIYIMGLFIYEYLKIIVDHIAIAAPPTA